MSETKIKRTILCILDGLGIREAREGNAVALARKPTLDALFAQSPHTTLLTHGERVGLPAGQMGNSEVGHLNIGAGRVVEQQLVRISRELLSGVAFEHAAFTSWCAELSDAKNVHLIGLYSDGGVHSHLEHLQLLVTQLEKSLTCDILIHVITDGRDTSPTGSADYIAGLITFLETTKRARIATVCGRFFAMDRDQRWERVERAYKLIAEGHGASISSALQYVHQAYETGTTDEFIEPGTDHYHGIEEGDGVLFWNYRADRMRELVSALVSPAFDHFPRPAGTFASEKTLLFTDYDPKLELESLFKPIEIRKFLGEALADVGLTQLRAAETEKYPHVTYFLNGGQELECKNESRILVPSPRDVKTYDLKPEMSAYPLTEAVCSVIDAQETDFICINFANCDMVGHTGVVEAGIKAVVAVDTCLGKLLEKGKEFGWQTLILADHGNAEFMTNEDGSPNTAHTINPVPLILFNGPAGVSLHSGGALCDVAPTILELMGLEIPGEMTGRSLVKH